MKLSKLNEFVLPLMIIGCLLVFIVPLPGWTMDLLLAGNIAIGLVVLLTTLHIRTPLEFSVFPTVLLATTLARLVLNVATTRLILTKADTSVGLSAAGDVVRQFGEFVSGDRLIVGLVIFTIIFVIQMMVITKGATRISEVAARFALDGIPGRQLAIDADLNAGVIDQNEAQQRRATLNRHADFYGAMDGASKFVRGDAIAGVVITVINIVGGLFIGVIQSGMPIVEATELYTKLTIGDGLVSQIPALLISLAAGLLVTRSSESSNLPVELLKQLFRNPQVLGIAGIFLGLLVFTKLPSIPLLLLATGLAGLALSARNQEVKEAQATPPSRPTASSKAGSRSTGTTTKRIEDFLQVDPVEVELGVGLLRIASAAKGGDLLARVTKIRESIAGDLGLVLPSVRVRDNLQLTDQKYAIKFNGNVVAEGSIPTEGVVVLPPEGAKSRTIPGAVAFAHPALDRRTRLVPLNRVGDAKTAGWQPLSPSSIVAEHLRQVVYDLSHELLTRDATQQLIDEVKKTSPTVVEELIPSIMKLSEVQQVLRALLKDGVPIRQLATILEALGDVAMQTEDAEQLTELVRQKLSRTISARYCGSDGKLHCVTLDPHLEQQLSTREVHHDVLSLPQRATFQRTLRAMMERLATENRPLILLTKSDVRISVLQIARAVVPSIVVLAQEEVARHAQVRSVGIVGLS